MKKFRAILILAALAAILLISQKANMVDCPTGYVDCQGVCVPYPCPN